MLEIEKVLIGILQGIFEWLPISSEGIVALLSNFLLKEINPIDFAIVLHLGTLFAVLIYFFKDFLNVLLYKDRFLFWFLAISTPVSLIVGFILYKIVNYFIFGNILLLLTGFGLIFTSLLQKRKLKMKIHHHKLAILVGILQGFSVIPGFSRSASTIFGLSLGQFSPYEILKISYMMSVPLVFLSSLYLYFKNPQLFSFSIEALFSSFLSGILTLHFLMRISQRLNFSKFTFIFGLLCIVGFLITLFYFYVN